MDIKALIRSIPDFPKKGILFRDITTLLKEKGALLEVIKQFKNLYENKKIDKIVAIESRGFIFGAPLAIELNAGFVPVRKKGKLPAETVQVSYALEYGTDTLEIHKDAILVGESVLIVDDLLATGGTACAVAELLKKLNANITGFMFLIELTDLKGREKLSNYTVKSLIKY